MLEWSPFEKSSKKSGKNSCINPLAPQHWKNDTEWSKCIFHHFNESHLSDLIFTNLDLGSLEQFPLLNHHSQWGILRVDAIIWTIWILQTNIESFQEDIGESQITIPRNLKRPPALYKVMASLPRGSHTARAWMPSVTPKGKEMHCSDFTLGCWGAFFLANEWTNTKYNAKAQLHLRISHDRGRDIPSWPNVQQTAPWTILGVANASKPWEGFTSTCLFSDSSAVSSIFQQNHAHSWQSP